MKRNLALIINQLGIYLLVAICINFYLWLFFAILNGGEVTVYFNHFGEAMFEYVMYLIILPIIIYAVRYEVRETRRKRKGIHIKFNEVKCDKCNKHFKVINKYEGGVLCPYCSCGSIDIV